MQSQRATGKNAKICLASPFMNNQNSVCIVQCKKNRSRFSRRYMRKRQKRRKIECHRKVFERKKKTHFVGFFVPLLNDKQGIFTLNHAVQKETYWGQIYMRRISLPCIVLFQTASYCEAVFSNSFFKHLCPWADILAHFILRISLHQVEILSLIK